MEVQRALVDRQFDRYVLSTEGIEKQEAGLPAGVLQPLDAANTPRKAQWEARVHHNALTPDPFRSDALQASVAYYVDSEFQVMQIIWRKDNGLDVTPIHQLPTQHQRAENSCLQVAGLGLLVASDGNGTLRILKSGDARNASATWEVLYEFQPLPGASSLLVSANFDSNSEHFTMLLAEPLSGTDKDASYRLWVAEVGCAKTSDSMDVDSGVVGLEHNAFEIGTTSALPDFASFEGPELALLVDGACTLIIETKSLDAITPTVADAHNEAAHAAKRHHDESDLDMDVDEVLSKVPRAGIGYHGDVSDIKHSHELVHEDDLAKPLAERFRKSSIPYSSLDEPLHSTTPEAVRSPKSQALDGQLEIPTPETILGGFEECDDVDPNAKAVILLINVKQQVVQDKLDINCRSFRYLGKGALTTRGSRSLLFQNDVHGLVFELHVAASRLKLVHKATFPAFGFVQASKQDKKYLGYDARASFSCIAEFEKRLFVYHGEPFDREKDSHVRKQNVVEIGDHQLLGMGVVGTSILLLSAHHIYHVAVHSP